jgi:hypothetical protein
MDQDETIPGIQKLSNLKVSTKPHVIYAIRGGRKPPTGWLQIIS